MFYRVTEMIWTNNWKKWIKCISVAGSYVDQQRIVERLFFKAMVDNVTCIKILHHTYICGSYIYGTKSIRR